MVGAAVVGAAVVGVGLPAVSVGFAVVWPGFGDDFPGFPPDAGDVDVTTTGALVVAAATHDTVYVAGLEAAATGLVTTSTTSPDAGSAAGVIVSGGRVFVPAALSVTVRLAESCPSASAQ